MDRRGGPETTTGFHSGDAMMMLMMYQSEAHMSIYLCDPLCLDLLCVPSANPKTTEPWCYVYDASVARFVSSVRFTFDRFAYSDYSHHPSHSESSSLSRVVYVLSMAHMDHQSGKPIRRIWCAFSDDVFERVIPYGSCFLFIQTQKEPPQSMWEYVRSFCAFVTIFRFYLMSFVSIFNGLIYYIYEQAGKGAFNKPGIRTKLQHQTKVLTIKWTSLNILDSVCAYCDATKNRVRIFKMLLKNVSEQYIYIYVFHCWLCEFVMVYE